MQNEQNIPWIILVTHGTLGEALIGSVEMIVGKLKNVKAISLMLEEPPEELAAELGKAIDEAKSDKVLILVDLFGGTPANVSAAFAKKGYLVLSGVNLPLLLGAEMCRTSKNWNDILPYLQNEVGVKSIVNITERVNNKK